MEKKDTYTVTCKFCGKKVNLELYPSHVKKYKKGLGSVQEIFSYLTPGEREILISRMCEDCFERLFSDED